MPTSSRPLTNFLTKAYGLWFVAIFACTAILTLGLVAVMPGQDNRRRLARGGARLLFRLTGAWPVIRGLDQLPTDAAVVVANHASYLDGILLTAALPHRFQFVIKREITQVPLVHFFLRRIGAHFVERFDAKKGATDARRIMQTATNGGSLVFFPEGTFRREPGLRRFHKGAFMIAARNGLPVVPLVINGTRSMLPAHEWIPQPGALEVLVQSPLPLIDSANPIQARDESRQAIMKELTEPDLHPANTEN
jgi:1-acyl-sn-glycerol-3-phosphate acyltransferase